MMYSRSGGGEVRLLTGDVCRGVGDLIGRVVVCDEDARGAIPMA